MAPEGDDALLDQARGGDRAALEALLAKYEGTIFGFASAMCRQPQDAEGVLQDTMIAMASGLPDFRGDASTRSWALTIARNACLKRRRRGKFDPKVVESLEGLEEPLSGEGSPEDQAARAQLMEAARGAIAGLDAKYRQVLVLRDLEQRSASETAELLGLTVAGVKSRLHRARTQIREAMEAAVQ